jgi:class 3 adenylate cyclase
MSGFELLEEIRLQPRLQPVPVIVLTSSGENETKLQALQLGATDFLAKPVEPLELALRVRNNLRVKRFQDELAAAGRQSEGLVQSILPSSVAERLKRGETVADHFEEATVLFADLVNFTTFAAQNPPDVVVTHLNRVFRSFDLIVESSGLEKIKTIGDAYMLVGGVPKPFADHAAAVVAAGLAMLSACRRLSAQGDVAVDLRIGIHTGPLMAGVIGRQRFAYDVWGDTVNVASRMEATSVAGRVQISEATRLALNERFSLEPRGEIEVKGKGRLRTSFVLAATCRVGPTKSI